jgi:uncharacterized membrane protein YkvI
MNKKNKRFMITAVLFMAIIWAFVVIEKGTSLFQGLDLVIFILIIISGIIALYNAFKKDKELAEGQPEEDELSNLIKYKSGYYAYMASLYMWLFFFLMKDMFPNIESLIGGGILLTALFSFLAKLYVKKQLHEE